MARARYLHPDDRVDGSGVDLAEMAIGFAPVVLVVVMDGSPQNGNADDSERNQPAIVRAGKKKE